MQPPVDLLGQADIAMYQVKSWGATPVLFDPQMQIAINQRVQLEHDLQMAITGNQFELHYQPQQRLDGQIVGVEGLIRWRHPERGWWRQGIHQRGRGKRTHRADRALGLAHRVRATGGMEG